ncbi:MAG TPA: hypothetical protein ENG40_00175, partial [Thermoprotei archaeon]|nr:hypothetical protein [Thermoprotei archaeon]
MYRKYIVLIFIIIPIYGNIALANNMLHVVKNCFINILNGYEEYRPLIYGWRKIFSINFKEISNETLSKLLVKTSNWIIVPSSRIFVSSRGLYLYNTGHIFLNIPILYRYDSVIMMASIKFISGADRNFARGGIGFGYRA